MQEASIPGLLKTIIYIVGFYYVTKFLARIFMPMLFKQMVNKAQENFSRQQEQFNQQYNTNQSNTSFESSNTKYPKATKQVGDYIDFEEIKD